MNDEEKVTVLEKAIYQIEHQHSHDKLSVEASKKSIVSAIVAEVERVTSDENQNA